MTTTAVNRHTRPTPTPTSSGVAFAPLVLAVLLLVGGLALSTGMSREDVVDGVAMMSFPAVGGLLLHRGIAPRIGWILSLTGVLVGLSIFAGGYSDHDLPGQAMAMLVSEAAFVVVMTVLLTFLPLLFPTGELPSPRWRFAAWASAATLVAGVVPVLFGPGVIDEDVEGSPVNPIGIAGAEALLETIELVALGNLRRSRADLPGVDAVAAASQLGAERRQIGILSAGVAILVVMFLLDSPLQSIFGDVYGVIGAVVAISAIPVAVGIALLRRTSPSRSQSPTSGEVTHTIAARPSGSWHERALAVQSAEVAVASMCGLSPGVRERVRWRVRHRVQRSRTWGPRSASPCRRWRAASLRHRRGRQVVGLTRRSRLPDHLADGCSPGSRRARLAGVSRCVRTREEATGRLERAHTGALAGPRQGGRPTARWWR